MAYHEIEVKLYVLAFAPIQQKLDSLGAACIHERVYERNIRYDKPAEGFADKGLVLRLRQDSVAKLTYKEPQNEAALSQGIHQRFEAEVVVSDFDTMNTILERLGYQSYMIYEKYRTTYTLDDVEIVLDEMPYGLFVEVEAENAEQIQTILDKLDLTDTPRIAYSYAQLFDHVRHHLNLSCRDLTFDNFTGITVPVNAFEPPTK